MKRIGRITPLILAGSALAIATLASPSRATNGAQDETASRNPVELQSASGTIELVESDSFTLRTVADDPEGRQFTETTDAPKLMTFLIDKDTAVDGKLTVGATASVIYREDNGKNLAVNVIADE